MTRHTSISLRLSPNGASTGTGDASISMGRYAAPKGRVYCANGVGAVGCGDLHRIANQQSMRTDRPSCCIIASTASTTSGGGLALQQKSALC
jgi:hypothetical protein